MTGAKRQRSKRMAMLPTVCGVVLLLLLVATLIVRYQAMERELDRMLVDSLEAHTKEAGEGAGYLIRYSETSLNNIYFLLQEEERAPQRSWVETVVKTFDLADDRVKLNYLNSGELSRTGWGSEEPELVQQILAGEAVVSGILSDPTQAESYVIVACPVEWDGRVVGALLARIDADTLLHQGNDSTFFHSVHSVIAGEDGRVIYGISPEVQGLELAALDAGSGLSQKEAEAFQRAYQESPSGSFSYDMGNGRNYVAWASASYHGWRVVQFSQSPNVRIEQTAMVQTGVMLVSVVVCALLAALMWRQRARLAEERLRYDTLAAFKDTLLFEYDCDDDSLEFTSNALESLDMEDTRLEGVTGEDGDLSIFHPDDIENVRQVFRSAAGMTPDRIDHDRIRIRKRDGSYSWYRSQYKALFEPDGRAVRLIGTLTDISSQIDRELELRKQAQQDPLTGLYNRAGIKLINARLEQISRGILFMLDLDDFKTINDTYGHATGDKALIAVGEVLKETFRTDDIIARVGGDEFIAFLSGSDNELMARQKAQELLDRVHSLRIEGIDQKASVSVGIARAPGHGRTYEALSLAADEALYEVKKNGKGGYALR